MAENRPRKKFTLHLISDATGTTLLGLARACLAQFEDVEPQQKFWPLIRTQKQLDKVIAKINENPGPVIFTLVDPAMRERVQTLCTQLGVPCVPVLDPLIRGLSGYLGAPAKGVPGLQHIMDESYFKRIEAVDYAMRHDDGQMYEGLDEADVILVGVSRTSKTPTSIYLARRGVRVANIPLVPNVDLPPEIFDYQRPLYIGLTATPERLVNLRRSRLKADDEGDKAAYHTQHNDYLDLERIEEEIKQARRLFSGKGWPVIKVTKKSIEETSAEILSLYQDHLEKENKAGKREERIPR